MLPLWGQCGPGSNSNEGVLCIPQSSRITGTLQSDCFVSYPGYSWGGGSYPSAEKQSVTEQKCSDVFSGCLGRCNKMKAKFKLKENVQLVFKKNRSVPFALLKQVNDELDRLKKKKNECFI